MNERAWPPKKNNNIWICWKLRLKLMILQKYHIQRINFYKQSILSWQKRKKEEHNANNMTTDTFIQTPVTTNAPREKTDVAYERRTSSDSLTEMLKVFNRLTIQSKIYNSTDYHSNKNVAESDPKSYQLVVTYNSDEKKNH